MRWWNDAVGGEKNRSVEFFDLLLLLPPSIAVVAFEMRILFEEWVIVSGQHLAMSVNVDFTVCRLFKQLFQVL